MKLLQCSVCHIMYVIGVLNAIYALKIIHHIPGMTHSCMTAFTQTLPPDVFLNVKMYILNVLVTSKRHPLQALHIFKTHGQLCNPPITENASSYNRCCKHNTNANLEQNLCLKFYLKTTSYLFSQLNTSHHKVKRSI